MLKNLKGHILFAIIGLLLGYLFFGLGSDQKATPEQRAEESMGKWTCSMHPEVSGKENGKCPLCSMDLVYVDMHGSVANNAQFEMSDEAMALANVQTSKVGYSDNDAITFTLSGIITTNEETDAIQTTLFEGRLDALYTNYVGKKVNKGQEIGKIYSPELFLAQDKLLTSVSYKETHQKLYAAARNSLGLWKMTDEQVDQMLKDGKPMMNFPFYADVSGTITEVLGKEGNYYAQGTPLFKVSNLKTVWAVFDAYESELAFLKEGQPVKIALEGFPGQSIQTKIDLVEPILQRDKHTLSVRVVLDNREGQLKPGMFAKAEVMAQMGNEPMLTVPKSAVLWTGKRSVVYKKVEGQRNVFEMAEVELGHKFENSYRVLDGLLMGEEVVTNGAFTIDAAAQLNGKKSMLNRTKMEMHGQEMPMMDLENAPKKIEINATTRDDFKLLLDDYVALKDALVEANNTKASKLADTFKKDLTGKHDLFPEVVHGQLKDMDTRLGNLAASNDIGAQRKAFKHLSESMVMMASSFSGFDQSVYVQHCDCVDNFTGGDWLSFNEKILNPYFGDKMLTCGRVEKILN